MDSGNSGSMSSSGGDEEYDSRSDSLPPFLNPSTHFGSLSSSNLFSHHHQQQQQPTFFDPSPNLFHPFSQSPSNPINPSSSLLNLDLVRSRSLRSNNNQVDCTDLVGNNNNLLLNSSASASAAAAAASSSSHQSILGSVPSIQLRSVQDNNGGPSSSARSSSSPSDQTHLVTRNPKKRTRASRRAPTTVLTTDTSNFRAMVQEFTGIPAPPFSSASGSPYSRRLDLFGSGMSMRSTHLEPMGISLYPLRPSAQKLDHHQQSPLLFSSSTSLNNNTATNATTTTSINYSDLDLGVPKQPQNMLNPLLSFQSLLQPPPPIHPSLPLPLLEDHLGMNINNNISGLHGTTTTTTQGMRPMMRNINNDHNQDHLRSLDSCKLNYSANSSSDFHDKAAGLENVPPRAGEAGTVDSWICPSE